jgi:tRNA 2-thiouridine synthesizing protein C
MRTVHVLVVLRADPHASLRAIEARDFALAALAFEQRVSLLLMGEGVGLLRPGQDPAGIGREDLLPGLRALLHHGLERLAVVSEDLAERGLEPGGLALPTVLVDRHGLPGFLAAHDHCVGF